MVSLFLLIYTSFAQISTPNSTSYYQAGNQMIMFANTAQAGIILTVLGSGVIAASALPNVAEPNILIAGGAIIFGIGLVTHIVSFVNIRKAGKILQRIEPTTSGIGIKIPLNKS